MLETDMNNAGVLVKSTMKSQKKKKLVTLIVGSVALLVLIVFSIVQYVSYRKAQKFGINAGIYSGVTKDNRTYERQCNDMYNNLKRNTAYAYFGVTNDRSRDLFEKVMKTGGYDGTFDGDVANWFVHTNYFSYFFGYYWRSVVAIICYIVILGVITFMIYVIQESKKQILVCEDSVICKTSPKKSKSLPLGDISQVDVAKDALRLVGRGISFQISNLTNADEIKSAIMEQRTMNQRPVNDPNASSTFSTAEELKKYKDLYDNGIISQEEYDAKKKQLLGL